MPVLGEKAVTAEMSVLISSMPAVMVVLDILTLLKVLPLVYGVVPVHLRTCCLSPLDS